MNDTEKFAKNLTPFYKSVLNQDNTAIVICDINHIIIYMNPKACENYDKWGGASLLGKSIMDCHNPASRQKMLDVTAWFKADKSHNCVHTFFNEKQNKDVYMIALRDEKGELIGYYEKHEFRSRDESAFYKME